MRLHSKLAPVALLACEAAQAAQGTPPGYSSAGDILQVLLGLGAVLVIMWACARALKHYVSGREAATGALRVRGGIAVGQRERVVMVEVGETWVLLGVAPGRVNALHVMDKLPEPPSASAPPAATSGFAAALARLAQRGPK